MPTMNTFVAGALVWVHVAPASVDLKNVSPGSRLPKPNKIPSAPIMFVPSDEHATHCQKVFVGAPVIFHVVPVFVDVKIALPHADPKSIGAVAMSRVPSSEQASELPQ